MTTETSESFGFSTRQIHAGEFIDAETSARITPIYQTAGYQFASFDDGEDRFAGRGRLRAYSRSDNPTNAVAGKRLASLEGGVDGIVVSSGQAAIATTISALARAGDHILATASLYEGTRELLDGSLSRQGISVDYVSAEADESEWLARATESTRAIYTESVPNPLNDVVDLAKLATIAEKIGVPLVIDNTVATPYLCRPFEWGAHIVIHSTSKWLAGHGAVIGGAIIDSGTFDWRANASRFPHLTQPLPSGTPSFVERFGDGAFLAYVRSVVVLEYGPTVPPSSTFLLLHGIETLSLRMDRHVSNAYAVASAIEGHPAVSHVHYPGLATDKYHERAARYLPRGAGSVVSIDLRGGRQAARTFIDSLTLVSPMTHIGDVRSLAIHLGSTIHAKLSAEQQAAVGITPGLVRLSIGLEDSDDIIRDLVSALDRAHNDAR